MISAVSCNAIVAVEFADAIKLCFCFFVFFFSVWFFWILVLVHGWSLVSDLVIIFYFGAYIYLYTQNLKGFSFFFFSFRVIYFDIIYDLLFLLIWVQLKLELVPKKLKENIIFQNRSEMEFDLPNKRTVWLTGVTRHFVSPKKSY